MTLNEKSIKSSHSYNFTVFIISSLSYFLNKCIQFYNLIDFKSLNEKVDLTSQIGFGFITGSFIYNEFKSRVDKNEMRVDMEKMRNETRIDMEKMRNETRIDMEKMRNETRADMKEMRADMKQMRIETLTYYALTLLVTTSAIIVPILSK